MYFFRGGGREPVGSSVGKKRGYLQKENFIWTGKMWGGISEPIENLFIFWREFGEF